MRLHVNGANGTRSWDPEANDTRRVAFIGANGTRDEAPQRTKTGPNTYASSVSIAAMRYNP